MAADRAGGAAADVLATDDGLTLAGTDQTTSYAELMARNGLALLTGDGDYNPVEEVNGPNHLGHRASPARAV